MRNVKALLGKKIGMTQIFAADGTVVPVSVMQAGPCVVLEKKSQQGKDGYSAVKLGFQKAKEKHLTKPQLGFFKNIGQDPVRHVKEIRVPEKQLDEFEVGANLDATLFEEGDIVNISAKSKGRGFAGVMKRWNFAGFRMTHGVHESYRGPGSVGCSTWPGKIWKGKKMPGQYGNKLSTVENLTIVKVLADQNLVMVKGAIPGHRNSILTVKSAPKKWKRS
jgi:large subunit ribosomal protein L3